MGITVEVRETEGAPDGGWGWIVLLGGFVITGFSYAFPKAISVYFKELMHDFGCGYKDTAWISSIILAMLYGSGPVSSIMVNKFGCRPVMLVGGLLASGGMISASFTTNIIQLYLTAGVITGLGLALNFQPSLIMLGTYFDKRRPLANGLAAAGSPVFLSVLSPLGQELLNRYGWRGGFLITGGLLLNCCTCAAVMRPLQRKKRTAAACSQELKEMLPPEAGQEKIICENNNDKKPTKKKLLDFSVLCNRGLIIYVIAKFIVVLGLFVPTILLVNYAKDQGVPDQDAAFLLSIIGFIDIFARPTCGLLAGLKWIRPKMAYFFSLALLFNGLTDVCSAKSTDYKGLVIFCVFFGLSYGMVGALQFEVLMSIVGTSSFSSALGLVLLIEAVAVLIGPPSAGYLVDKYKNYELIFYMAGGELIIAGIFLAFASFFCLNQKKPKDSQQKNHGRKGHKGRGKQFSNPEEIDRQMKAQRELEANEGAERGSSSESEEESSSDDEQPKRKGVEGLIEIENPNRIAHKSKKVVEIDVNAPKELSRREREEIEKQKAKERYMKLHLEGKTDQARADLARLAIIKKQREDAAKKREELRKGELISLRLLMQDQ
ncbi:Monocarboxylate transporter 3 [Anabarilius grahami]|uniref:Monocarboxylate transporter 3 n=1 Tax=Anabarilius grahami TaxID=495550 RepID=A0A3N0Z088_ANAGA|nr:Monocarboxylate transporter 3 [Anabarilius grahami]